MTINVTVLYPNDPDLTIDVDYWVKTHMPLVQNAFTPHMKSWRLIKCVEPPTPQPALKHSDWRLFQIHKYPRWRARAIQLSGLARV